MKDRFVFRFVGGWVQTFAVLGLAALSYKTHETLTFIALCVWLVGIFVAQVLPKRLDEMGR